MKKIVLMSALCLASSLSFAAGTAVCAATGVGTQITDVANFVKVAFTPKCSPNTHASIEQSPTILVVATGSSKGKTYWGGSTNGGSVAKNSDCPSTGCVATTGLTATILSDAAAASN